MERGPDRAVPTPHDPAWATELAAGELRILGRLTEASNATFLADLGEADDPADVDLSAEDLWVYKPRAGEKHLWDFPDGTLGLREVAAYALSHAAGFDVVPLTVPVDGPLGEGSAQLWVHATSDAGAVDVFEPAAVEDAWIPILDAEDGAGHPLVVAHRDLPRLRRIALFDAITNNSDRKGAHLVGTPEHCYGVDHGLCFHADDKLRTVLWGWAGAPLDADENALLTRAAGALDSLDELLTEPELLALERRIAGVLAEQRLPEPSDAWPSIPWPPL